MAKKGLENIYPPVNFKLGRPLKYTPEELREKFLEYVDWAYKHPIVVRSKYEAKSVEGVDYGNTTTDEKPRLVSIQGFVVYLGATLSWWGELDRSKMDFSAVKSFVREFCESYQKEMASAGLFKENIISRLLGLADKQNVQAQIDNRIVVENTDQANKIANIESIEE